MKRTDKLTLLKAQEDITSAMRSVVKGHLQKAPPGPPPRPGLQWNENSHRWIRPKDMAGQSDGSPSGSGPSESASSTSFSDLPGVGADIGGTHNNWGVGDSGFYELPLHPDSSEGGAAFLTEQGDGTIGVGWRSNEYGEEHPQEFFDTHEEAALAAEEIIDILNEDEGLPSNK